MTLYGTGLDRAVSEARPGSPGLKPGLNGVVNPLFLGLLEDDPPCEVSPSALPVVVGVPLVTLLPGVANAKPAAAGLTGVLNAAA